MSPAFHPGFSDLWRSPSGLSSTPATFGCLLFLIVLASSFLIHLPFPKTRLPLVTDPSLCSTCLTYRAPCHGSSQSASHPNLTNGSEVFYACASTRKYLLIYVSLKEVYMASPIFIPKSPYRILTSFSLVLNQSFKKSHMISLLS